MIPRDRYCYRCTSRLAIRSNGHDEKAGRAVEIRCVGSPPAAAGNAQHDGATRWQWRARRLMETRVGVVPLPVYVLLVALIGGFVMLGEVPTDMPVSIAVLVVGGFTRAEFGKRPLLRHISTAAIFATYVPSFLVYLHAIPPLLPHTNKIKETL